MQQDVTRAQAPPREAPTSSSENASSFSDASPGVSHPIHTPLLRVPRRLLTSRSDPVSVVSLSVDHRSGN
ncbi:hypothetical protein BHE90_011206 [Fusarium euwallaceae]|uniref:Uncharacterized protein n=1 Tax=Fusarium euwallaceae TaxID=1147111 RepID=A0A430LF44_9HYPO|nr:hypothetical protein BHE90_011206 [Fusarium euwallaceae]